MINFEALFKISYGLYIVCSGNKERANGFICNTVFQVTAEPPNFAVCCSKNNYTADFIVQSKCFSVTVLHKDTSSDIIGRFGYKTGKVFDKLQGMQIAYYETGAPVVLNDAIAFFECKVLQTIDLGTHLLFISELIHSEILNDTKEPLTYQYFRQTRKGAAPKNAPTFIDKSKLENNKNNSEFKKFQCAACGYIYDEAIEETKFSDFPNDWVCPTCGTEKDDFIEI